MAADRVLREHTGHDSNTGTSQRFPPFFFIGKRNIMGDTINPYLVILAAEIKFRRYLAANGPHLPPVYDSLMRKTIQVADLLYFRPERRTTAFDAPIPTVTMPVINTKERYAEVIHDVVDDSKEMGAWTGTNNGSGDSTVRQTDTGGRTRQINTGGGTRHVDPGPDYWRHMLSGRGRFHIFSWDSLVSLLMRAFPGRP